MDVFAVAQQALVTRSPIAYPLAGLFGVVSSLGPCAVTRYAAVAQASSTARRPMQTVAVFVAGLVVMYGLFGVLTSMLGFVQFLGAYLFLIGGVVFVAWGLRTAWVGLNGDHASCAVDHDHEHDIRKAPGALTALTAPVRAFRARVDARYGESSLVGVFLLGVASACMISPCCAPFLGLTITVTASAHDPLFGASILSVFALGHAVPLVLYGIGGAYVARVARAGGGALASAVSVTLAALMIGVGISYLLQV
jgi:cytochrome c biogenesis protein CcdA